MKDKNFFGKSRMVPWLALLFLTGGFFSPLLAEDKIAIRHLQLTLKNDNELSLRLIADKPIDYRAFVLNEPYRIVLDGLNIDWQLPQHSPTEGIGFIERYRFGNFNPRLGRLVLDATEPVVINSIAQHLNDDGGVVITLQLVATDQNDFAAYRSQGILVSREGISFEDEPPPVMVRKTPRTSVSRQKPLLVIDAGHGGLDSGAISVSGMKEKEINLDMSRRLARLINQSGQADAILTRQDDRFIPLTERSKFASLKNADLFLSIHADSIHKAHIKGLSIYSLSDKASDAVAATLAQQENKSDILSGIDLSRNSQDIAYILIDLVQKQSMKQSKTIAQFIIEELRGKVDLLHPTHRFAGFVVLKAPDVPSLLIEIGYLSNPEEDRKLRNPNYRESLARHMMPAILNGLKQSRKNNP